MELWDRSRPSINCNAISAKIKLAGVINYSIRMPLAVNGATIVAPNTKSYPTCEYVVYLLPCRILKGLWLTLTPTDLALIIFTHGVFFAYLVYPYLFWIRCIDLHFMCFIDTNLLSNIQLNIRYMIQERLLPFALLDLDVGVSLFKARGRAFQSVSNFLTQYISSTTGTIVAGDLRSFAPIRMCVYSCRDLS